jgi:hypothetical protein
MERTIQLGVVWVYYRAMRTKLPIPEPQGKTPMERMDWAFRTVLKVPKTTLLKQEKQAKRTPSKKIEKPA